jgi:hypothetical protein
MPASFCVPDRQRFILAKDLLIAILENKNVVEKKRCQQVDADGKKAGFSSRCKAGMLYYMQINRLQ